MSTLYVVATPIGNLGDLSMRAAQLLKDVDIIAAEDTRHTGQLLSHISATTTLLPLHDHNEKHSLSKVLDLLQSGKTVAIVSDAGTPLISDPGYALVRHCREAGIDVVPLPGASSVTAALSVCGLPTDRFSFEGFLPAKPLARQEILKSLRFEQRTVVVFEAPHRIINSVKDIASVMGEDRALCICREMTKTFEQIVSGTAAELAALLVDGKIPAKGEFVLVIAGASENIQLDEDELLRALLQELSPSKAARVAARVSSQPRSILYDRAMALRQEE